ncbi:MAG: hypothetical protein HC877_04265 [Thioploca sp.]|nr:hypothetical protein [Thioploca sp.]
MTDSYQSKEALAADCAENYSFAFIDACHEVEQVFPREETLNWAIERCLTSLTIPPITCEVPSGFSKAALLAGIRVRLQEVSQGLRQGGMPSLTEEQLDQVILAIDKQIDSERWWLDPLARGTGLLQVVGGGFEMVIGSTALLSPEPITTKVLGGAIALHGIDSIWVGIKQIGTGTFHETYAISLLEAAGVNPIIAMSLDIGFSFAGPLKLQKMMLTKTGTVETVEEEVVETGVDEAALNSQKTVEVGKVDEVSENLPLESPSAAALARQAAIENSHMVPAHAEAFLQVAIRRDEVIIMRPVNPYATERIAQNSSTKSMFVHGKSSDWGKHSGYIPRDQKYSKLGNPEKGEPDWNKINKYNAENEEAIAKGVVITVEVEGPGGIKIEVLADPHTKRPLTADYDLLAMGSQGSKGEMFFDPAMGSITEGQKKTIDNLNEAVQGTGYEGGTIVHHGPESQNPHTEGPDCLPKAPCTAYTPDGQIITLTNEQLKDFFKIWQEKGYNLEPHEKWGW